RVVGTGQQYLVAGLQQGPQRQVDQFADTVADEDPFGFHMARAARALLRGDGLARRFQTLLMTVRLALVQVAGDRFAQVRRRFEAVTAGVADVQLDAVMAGRLQLARAPGQRPADFVAYVGKVRTGDDRGQRRFLLMWGAGSSAGRVDASSVMQSSARPLAGESRFIVGPCPGRA